MIDRTVKLGFDPIQKFGPMWEDNEARILWLLWRPGHLVGDDFQARCLSIGRRIRETKPTTVEQLKQCFPGLSEYWTTFDVAAFAPEALPYFTGEKSIGWEYVQK